MEGNLGGICCLWSLGVKPWREGRGWGAGRAVPLDRYPCAQPEGCLWAKQKDSVILSFCFIPLFVGGAGHAFGFERKELTFTLNFTCKLLTSKQTRGSQGGEVGKSPSPTFLAQREAALATWVRSLALGITGTRLVGGGGFPGQTGRECQMIQMRKTLLAEGKCRWFCKCELGRPWGTGGRRVGVVERTGRTVGGKSGQVATPGVWRSMMTAERSWGLILTALGSHGRVLNKGVTPSDWHWRAPSG